MPQRDSSQNALVDPTVVPTPVRGDVTKLALERVDAFILSQVDGRSSVDELASLSGRPLAYVSAALCRLHHLGAIRVPGMPAARKTKAPPSSRRSATPSGRKTQAPPARRTQAPPGRLTGTPPPPTTRPPSRRAPAMAPADCTPRLSATNRRTLDIKMEDAFVLAQVDGVTSAAELAAIAGLDLEALSRSLARLERAGAIELAPRPVERPTSGRTALSVDVFGSPRRNKPVESTRPHQPPARRSTRPPRRATAPSMDASSPARSKTRPSLKVPKSPSRNMRPPPVLVSSTERAPTLPAPLPKAVSVRALIAEAELPPPPSLPLSRPRPRIRIATGRVAAPVVRVSVPDAPRVSMPALVTTDAGPLTAAPGAASVGAEPNASPRHAPAEKSDNRQHARIFVEAAERELATGNVVAAAAQFQLALTCCDTPEIRAAFRAVDEMARERKFEANKAQGETAEREDRWPDAVTAYTRAHAAQPGSRIGERLANAMRRTSGDLRLAAKLAEEAVQQEPTHPGFRVTLGEIYLDAGLDLRAQGEAKRALELAPGDPRAEALLARVTKSPRAR